jgi:hypothetical protein
MIVRRWKPSRAVDITEPTFTSGDCYSIVKSGDLQSQGPGGPTTTSASSTSSTSTTATVDPSHVAWLRFEGANDSTDFPNEWSTVDEWGQVYYAYYQNDGTPKIKTAQHKWGTSSLYTPAGSNIMSWDAADRFQPGAGAFTIHFWFKDDSVGHDGGLCCVGDGATSVQISFASDRIAVRINGTYYNFYCTINNNLWHHYAITRDDSHNLRAFLDGSKIGADQTSNEEIYASGRSYIGRNSQYGSNCNGYFDEFKILTGVCLWTASFHAPTTTSTTTTTTTTT